MIQDSLYRGNDDMNTMEYAKNRSSLRSGNNKCQAIRIGFQRDFLKIQRIELGQIVAKPD